MCGIAGYCLNPKDHQSTNTTSLAGQMLLDIEHRGQHATGAAWINSTSGNRVISKAPISASQYLPKVGARLCLNAATAILHTRWATQGNPSNTDNNHPIPRGNIVLTHNGHISNDIALFKQLNVKRRGQVDSEAVAALLAFAGTAHPTSVLPQVQGTAALAWIGNNDARTLHLARLNSSPLWIGQTKSGSLVYGSTAETIFNASIMLDSDLVWEYSAKEGEYFKVKDGKIVEHQTFTPYKAVDQYTWRDYSPRAKEQYHWWDDEDSYTA